MSPTYTFSPGSVKKNVAALAGFAFHAHLAAVRLNDVF
jgi:hypothetical protein